MPRHLAVGAGWGGCKDPALVRGSQLGCSPCQGDEEVSLDVLGSGMETSKLFFQRVTTCQAADMAGPDDRQGAVATLEMEMALRIKRQQQAQSLG